MLFSSSSMSEDSPSGRDKDLLHGFSPVGAVDAGEEPLFLILGSFPSVLSLERKEYYGNPKNHFWTVVSSCFGLAEPRSYDGKIELLKRCHIALWDVFACCERQGSLDKDIVRAMPNPVAALLSEFPTIKKIGANGGASASGFMKEVVRASGAHFSRIGDILAWKPSFSSGRVIHLVRLPSTSPVPTAAFKSASDKMPLWREFFTIRM